MFRVRRFVLGLASLSFVSPDSNVRRLASLSFVSADSNVRRLVLGWEAFLCFCGFKCASARWRASPFSISADAANNLTLPIDEEPYATDRKGHCTQGDSRHLFDLF